MKDIKIIVDGKRLFHCEYRFGYQIQKDANQADLKPLISKLFEVYTNPNSSIQKKEEAKNALLFLEEYLAAENSGNFKDKEMIYLRRDQKKAIENGRNARRRDISNSYSFRQVALRDKDKL